MHNLSHLTPKRPHFTPILAHFSQADREQLKKLKANPGLFANMFARQIENSFDEFENGVPPPQKEPTESERDLFDTPLKP